MPSPPSHTIENMEELLRRMTDRIRQSIELPEILDATVNEMRQFLGTDRVKVYRFHEDRSGEVVAEAIREQRLPSLLGHRFPACDIPEQAREMFLSAGYRTIVNVDRQEIGVSPLFDDKKQRDRRQLDKKLAHKKLAHKKQNASPGEISFRPVDPCHVDYLTAMGVQSSLVSNLASPAAVGVTGRTPQLPSSIWAKRTQGRTARCRSSHCGHFPR